MLNILFQVLFELLLGWLTWLSNKTSTTDLQAFRQAAQAQLVSLRIEDGRGNIHFDGSSAQVLKTTESSRGLVASRTTYSLTQWVVTPENRYFLLIASNKSKPYIKEVTPRIAKLVLKDDFGPYRKTEIASPG